MKLTYMEKEKIHNLAHRKFKQMLGRRVTKKGAPEGKRLMDQDAIKILTFYYKHFRKSLWI